MHVTWGLDGAVLIECPFDRRDLRHGMELSRHWNGVIEWQVRWVHGAMHGSAQQFDEKGQVLCRSPFRRGSGVDIWVQGSEIVEFREFLENQRHGIERWGHPLLPHEEAHYHRGRKTGIHRLWSAMALDDGYPKFFIDDQEVSKEAYRRIRAKRPALPAYRVADDWRARRLPKVFSAIWLRKEIRTALMKVPSPGDAIGCGAHVRGRQDDEC
jgi:hypothetical protein